MPFLEVNDPELGASGWEWRSRALRVVVVSGGGPRVAFLGRPGGRNLLFWDRPKKVGRGDWKMLGGHRIWTTRPGADESEETYAADNSPCAVKVSGERLTASGPVNAHTGLQRILQLRAVGPAELEVSSGVKNCSDMLWSGGVWSITCTRANPRTHYGVPLGDRSEWDVFSVVICKRWAGHTSPVNDRQLSFTEDCLVVKPRGVECKRMLQAPQGLLGMTDAGEKLTFVKQTEDDSPHGVYPRGCNLAFYLGPKRSVVDGLVELEAMGAQGELRPGETRWLKERWTLGAPIDWARYRPAAK
jgi:hypothetical protein